jgi:hypothetical protein
MTATPVTMRNCGVCGEMRQTIFASYHYNVGMLVIRRTYHVGRMMCRGCIHKKFWEYTGKNLSLGWWGYVSFFLTPIYFGMNVYSYGKAL